MIIYGIYVSVLIDTALNHTINHKNKQGILLFNVWILVSEFYQMMTIGHEYFLQVENYFDLTGIVYIFLFSTSHSTDHYQEVLER